MQEALLALPYAYSKLGVHGRAAVLYRQAARELRGASSRKLDASLESIGDGEFLKDLVREEIRQDKDWVIRLRSLPDAPETFYLATLMASHEFQTGAAELPGPRGHAQEAGRVAGRASTAFDDLIRRRREYYEPLLPEIDAQFRKLDSQMRLRVEQRDHLDQRLQHMLIAPRPDYLATADEQRAAARIATAGGRAAQARATPSGRRCRCGSIACKGVLTWNLETNYHERLTDAHKHLRELNADIDGADGAVRRIRAHAPGRDAELHRLRRARSPSLRERTARGARAPRRT